MKPEKFSHTIVNVGNIFCSGVVNRYNCIYNTIRDNENKTKEAGK
ncbi:MAG: hypothetical protein ACLRY5_13975 [Zhenhengia sp.]|jgi:hypothetical protein